MYLSHTKETIKYMLNALEKINKKKSALIIQIEIIYNKSLTEISKSCKKKVVCRKCIKYVKCRNRKKILQRFSKCMFFSSKVINISHALQIILSNEFS